MILGQSQAHAPQHAQMLVDLDSIFDTRLGTIAKFGIEEYSEVIKSGYYTRRSDHFIGIDPVKYRELYDNRDASTLANSMITHVVSLIKDFVTRVNITSATAPIKKVPRVDINVYPYDPPERVMQSIIQALRVHIADQVDVGYVRYSPADLHYDLVKFTYDHMVMYNIGPWLETHAEDWLQRNRGLPEVTVFSPAIHRGLELSEIPLDISDIVDEVSNQLGPVINLMQVPIQFFCSVLEPSSLANPSPEAKAPGDEDVDVAKP